MAPATNEAAAVVMVVLLLGQSTFVRSENSFDVLVYGATSGGITAAIAASRHAGVSVGLVVANGGGCGPSDAGANHIGGMTTGGLGKTDIGAAAHSPLIGGIAADFYSRVANHYNSTAPPSWNHEPHVALNVYKAMLNESLVHLIWGGHGANIRTAYKADRTISKILLADGRVLTASVYIDASYEGDLMAAVGASWVVGREARTQYNESMAGRQPGDYHDNYEFKVRVDPFDQQGNLLPLLQAGAVGTPGQADKHVQAYNFRLCATSDLTSMVPFPAPDPSSQFETNNYTWEMARRYFADPNWPDVIGRPGCAGMDFPCFNMESPPLNPFTGYKRDWNNPFIGPLNTDCVVGCNQSGYTTADLQGRLQIWEDHKQYYLSLLKFYSSDSAVPASIKNRVKEWGLCGDEFPDTDHWPPQLYTRETRRMVGDRVFTQNTPQETRCFGNLSIGVGDYAFDSHPTQRFACSNSSDSRCKGANPPWVPAGGSEPRPFAWSEGNVQLPEDPYSIPLWVLLPKRSQVTNLLVAATPSGSHIGFSSLRMEPQFMVLGHSAGTIAAIYIKNTSAAKMVQDVDVDVLTSRLLAEGQVLQPPACNKTTGGGVAMGLFS